MDIKYGYKKAQGVVVKLELLEDSIILNNNTKYRTNKAKVIGFYTNNGEEIENIYFVRSNFDPSFIYKLDSIVEVYDFDLNTKLYWGNGIHFYKDFNDAANYSDSNNIPLGL